jgi:DNA-binding transcriptional MerR regulator
MYRGGAYIVTIKEIEELTGLARANIRFYEREGLISPERMSNGYRNYSDDDLQELLRIKLLRSLNVSIDEIKSLQNGSLSLDGTLSRQTRVLEREKRDITYAQDICRAIQEEKVTYTALDAKKYLEGIVQVSKDTESTYFNISEDYVPQAFTPWRRFLARTFDLMLYSLLRDFLLVMLFRTNISSQSSVENFFLTYISLGLMLLIEPLWISMFNTTPGKAIFGLKIENIDRTRLTYGEAYMRTWGVIGAGMGYNIPILGAVRLWKSYKRCSENETQPWDLPVSYTIEDTKTYRGFVYVGANIALFAVLATLMSSQLIPPNRGDLTVAEFVENHNYYARYYGFNFGDRYLNDEGKWVQIENYGTVHVDTVYREFPEYKFELENGKIQKISFNIKITNTDRVLGSYDPYMFLTTLSLAGAQKDVGLFSKIPNRIASHIGSNSFNDYSLKEAGITATCDTDYSGFGFILEEIMIPDTPSENNHFSLSFSVYSD